MKFAFHLLPCGMLYDDKLSVLGNGVVLALPQLFSEIADVEKYNITWKNKLVISSRAHLTFRNQLLLDGFSEKKNFWEPHRKESVHVMVLKSLDLD